MCAAVLPAPRPTHPPERGLLAIDPELDAAGKDTDPFLLVRVHVGRREIKRCLARYVARDLYRLLENGAASA